MAKGVKFIRWDPAFLVDQVRSVCEVDANGCWVWRYGTFDREWYPDIMIKRRKQSVARWILEVTTGTTGEVARHRCDRMPCCNPEHLLWGSPADNVADCVARGRNATGDASGFRKYPEKYRGDNHWMRKQPERIQRGQQHWTARTPGVMPRGDDNPARKHPELLARGEQHGRAKLTDEKVREIRRCHAVGTSMYRLAKDHGVSKRCIEGVVKRMTWRHVS